MRFTGVEFGDLTNGGDFPDRDHDGLSNLLEYARNRDPRHPDATPGFTLKLVTVNGSPAFEATFQWNRFASDLQCPHSLLGAKLFRNLSALPSCQKFF